MVQTLKNAQRILRKKQVLQRTGVSSSFLYEAMSKRLFPSSVRIGARCVGWIESEIDDWIAARIAESRNLPKEAA